MSDSKPLGSEDVSGVKFIKEMLQDDNTYGINFDRIQWDNERERYIIIELLLCEEKQYVDPWSSHPNNYFDINSKKFISLWEITKKLNGILYLVNYAKKGTKHEDKVLFMRVKNVDPKANNPVKTQEKKMKREEFSEVFRALNRRGQK